MQTIVTSGHKYIDIDALACGVAYKELLGLTNTASRLIFTGTLNESITKTIKTWEYKFESSFQDNPKDYSYALMDVSDPAHFDTFVEQDNVIGVYDHRFGFEKHWADKLGNNSHIEMVGACATLIWEEYKNQGHSDKISPVSANLLYTAILSNTLNFQAQITTQRDIDAAEELTKHVNFQIEDWKKTYFQEVEEAMLANPMEALVNDTKELIINDKNYMIGQIELWDNTNFVTQNLATLSNYVSNKDNMHAFITSPCISKGINTLICTQNETKQILEKTIDATFNGDIGYTKKLWLRKEIMKELAKL